MLELKNPKIAVPVVLFAGLLWSFGAPVVRYMNDPHLFTWQYIFGRGVTIFILLNLYLYFEEGINFYKNNNPIILELGCGKGEYTTTLAKQNPDKNFIGIDIKGARIWTGAKESIEQKLKNVCFIRSQIELIDKLFLERFFLSIR